MPLLIDLNPSDLVSPLTQFQARKPNKADMQILVKEIDGARPEGARVEPQRLDTTFEKFWEDFEIELRGCIERVPVETAPVPKRSADEVMEEMLTEVRNTNRNTDEIAAGLRTMLATGSFILHGVPIGQTATAGMPAGGIYGLTGSGSTSLGHSASVADVRVRGLLGGLVAQPPPLTMAVGGSVVGTQPVGAPPVSPEQSKTTSPDATGNSNG